jgi:hypothetical protein
MFILYNLLPFLKYLHKIQKYAFISKNIKLLKFLLFVTLFYLKIQKKYVIQFFIVYNIIVIFTKKIYIKI